MDRDRFSISKIDASSGGNGNISPIVEDQVADSGNNSNGISLKGFNLLGRRFSKKTSEDRKMSLAQLTKEALPRLDNYRSSKRNLKRKSIGELHGEPVINLPDPESGTKLEIPEHGHGIKLGWIVGVVIPCLLNIWGVMLFLRLSWVVSQAGILGTLIIILISAGVCVITTLSLSAISTNGEVKGGGVYFIISRSLGPEFGASVGVVFAFANAVAASMNTIGFCDSLNELLGSNGLKIVDGGINDVRIVGSVALVIMIVICAVGMEWEAKAQNFLVVAIIAAIVDFLVGAALGPMGNEKDIAKGFVGLNWDTLSSNFFSDYRFSEGKMQDFFSVFAIFFPSVTGIQAGANISGDLKDPSASIPKGTLLALLISMISYILFVVFAGAGAVRDASGNISDVINGTMITSNLSCLEDFTCQYGLHNSYSVMQLMSGWGPLIYVGSFAACLSTALTNLLSVPRLVQALGFDQIYPGLIFFSKPYGKNGEPYRGYVLTFIISLVFLLIGQLNVIAPLISTFYLASYCLINFCTFHAAFVKPLGWRPTFKYYNAWLSLFGAVICIVIMFLIDWISSIITFVIILALYLVVMYRKPDVNWGSSTQEQTYRTALNAAYKMQIMSDHVKNYHPQVLVLSGDPKIRPPLIDFADLITKSSSLMMAANVIPISLGYKTRQAMLKEGRKYLAARKIKSFYKIMDGMQMEDGVNALIKATGYGKMSPNILLMGYKANWMNCRKDEVEMYFNILQTAFSQRLGVVILRLPNGLDFSDLSPEIHSPNGVVTPHQGIVNPSFTPESNSAGLLHIDSNMNLSSLVCTPYPSNQDGLYSNNTSFTIPQPPPMPNMQDKQSKKYDKAKRKEAITYLTKDGSEVPKDVLDAVTIFTRKQDKGTIDIYWLYDDGGLTVLLPYIISMRSNFEKSKLRVFALTNRRQEMELEEKNMANLLEKFRINFSQLIMLQGVYDMPKQETIKKHKALLNEFILDDSNGDIENELKTLEEKTHRQLRLHELVKEHSSNANLIVMSLPMPRKDSISPPVYLSWLEMLTCDVKCPFILARGNQTEVLTFYS